MLWMIRIDLLTMARSGVVDARINARFLKRISQMLRVIGQKAVLVPRMMGSFSHGRDVQAGKC